jgi:hypothetical protein
MKPPMLAAGIMTILCLSAAAEKEAELTAAQQAQLQRDKLIITAHSYRQIFTPYVFSPTPVFITSDSVLNAWHVLFEDSVRIMEERFAGDLPDCLDKALELISKEQPNGMSNELYEPALRRARLILGTAAKLAGGRWSGGKELDEWIAADVKLIEEARGVALPKWLADEGCDIVGFDYAVFRPAGFYTGSKRLERYFRAVRWLQTVPFDLKRDDQVAAMALIASAFDYQNPDRTVLEISKVFEAVLGKTNQIDTRALFHRGTLPRPFNVREWLERIDDASGVGDSNGKTRLPFVVLAARELPDHDLFNSTTNESRPFPDTLEVAALLGSKIAEKSLGDESDVLTKIGKARAALQDNDTVYGRYMACLAELFAPPEPEAPAFMKSDLWQRKNLNTSLAGWAQSRHTWSLQARENVYYWGDGESDPHGFVEPTPEFFRRLGSLVSQTRQILDRFGERPVSSLDVSRRAADLLPLIEELIEPNRQAKIARKEGRKLSGVEVEDYKHKMRQACDQLIFFLPVLKGVGGYMPVFDGVGSSRIGSFDDPESLMPILRKIAAGEGINEVMAKLAPSLKNKKGPDRWLALIEICHQLETLAYKQLRGVEPAKDEVKFIQSYGEKLGRVMLYDGNSWEAPRDDAPRITAVFNQPGRGFLLAGVGRAREIRVLYPWKGREIECHGTVMPYLEMRADRHLTDAEWKTVLDGRECPKIPAWLQPVTADR